MKQQITPGLKNLLLSAPAQFSLADCFTITLYNGSVYCYTSFDYDVSIGSLRFSSMGPRLKRGRLSNRRGLQTSQLAITIAPDTQPDASGGSLSSTVPPANIGALSLTQALVAGLLNGAQVRLETVYNPARQQDGSYSDNGLGSLIKFIGVVADASSTRGGIQMNVVSNLHQLEPMWPPYVFQPQCRWRLFDSGCKLNANNFAVAGTVIAASTPSIIYHGLTNPSGYFSGGRLVFNTGPNAGISRQIKTATADGSAASYATVVANDKPYVWLTLAGNANDSSGNGFNGTVNGGVTFGQSSLLKGDAGTAALFNGSNAFITVPVPRQSNWAQGVTFEFWHQLSSGAGANQPSGIFDTYPHASSKILYRSLVNAASAKDVAPGFQWYPDRPYVGIQQPPVLTPQHIVVVFRGAQSVDVYVNGQLWDSETQAGNGTFNWQNPIHVGRAITPGSGTVYFDGTLQHFAIYAFAMSPNQVLTHYTAGMTQPGTAGNGEFNMLHPFPYAPNVGDGFTCWPGCDKSMITCSSVFNNLINFGGTPFVPAPESGV